MKLSMGATHMKHDRLIQVVQSVQSNSFKTFIPNAKVNDTMDMFDNIGLKALPGSLLYGMYDYVAEEKYDGYCYLYHNNDFYSRNLSTAKETLGQPICKSNRVPHLIEELAQFKTLELDLQGEIYLPNGTSDDVTRVMGCTPEKAIARQEEFGKLQYKIVDIRSYKGIDLTRCQYHTRRAILETLYDMYFQHCQYVSISRVMPDAINSFARIIRRGGEGLVIKNANKTYIAGKKPADHWIKCKKEYTADCVIMDFNKGTGKNARTFGSMQVGLYINGKLTPVANVSSGIPDILRQEISDNKDKYINSVIEIQAMQPNTNKVSFRHPRFIRLRNDKVATQCSQDGITLSLDILGGGKNE